MTVHIFGIRHHGPGSARSLLSALETLQPDCILVEGPPDADDLLPLMVQRVDAAARRPADLRPCQHAAAPLIIPLPNFRRNGRRSATGWTRGSRRASWICRSRIAFALMRRCRNAQIANRRKHRGTNETPEDEHRNLLPDGNNGSQPEATAEIDPIRLDPLRALAEAAGYSDSERWWEHHGRAAPRQQRPVRGDSRSHDRPPRSKPRPSIRSTSATKCSAKPTCARPSARRKKPDFSASPSSAAHGTPLPLRTCRPPKTITPCSKGWRRSRRKPPGFPGRMGGWRV